MLQHTLAKVKPGRGTRSANKHLRPLFQMNVEQSRAEQKKKTVTEQSKKGDSEEMNIAFESAVLEITWKLHCEYVIIK